MLELHGQELRGDGGWRLSVQRRAARQYATTTTVAAVAAVAATAAAAVAKTAATRGAR